MFNRRTVFILGAGASWHYGYPTGEELVKKVTEKARQVTSYFAHSHQKQNSILPDYITNKIRSGVSTDEAWKIALKESERIRTALTQTNPLVIDYFLGWSPELKSIGTLLITWVILECEKRGQIGNINRLERVHDERDLIKQDAKYLQKFNDNWCRFIIHQLAIGCKQSSDLLANDVTFVTFNYDISLEHTLQLGLQHIELFKKDDIQTFLGSGRVLHVYGAIRPSVASSEIDLIKHVRDPSRLSWEQVPDYWTQYKKFLDKIYAASHGLRVIDPHDKETDKVVIEAARKAIADARSVYILGYGFDENNSARLQLRDSLNWAGKQMSVFFTNFGDINRVNKRASKLFFGNDREFFSGGPAVLTRTASLYERSARNVYEALELDFESFE